MQVNAIYLAFVHEKDYAPTIPIRVLPLSIEGQPKAGNEVLKLRHVLKVEKGTVITPEVLLLCFNDQERRQNS